MSTPPPAPYDAILLVSFGGPEGPDDVIPFLENVLQGRNVPRQRMLAVAEHYQRFGGRSPINDQNRALLAALRSELDRAGPALPVYWGNRNWHPLLPDTLRSMAADGIRRALAIVTSAFSSYSGCRQYREDIARATAEVGSTAPQVDKIRVFYNHPGFIEPMREHTRAALARFPAERRDSVPVVFSAHSIPLSMADSSPYVAQLNDAARLVIEGVNPAQPWRIAYQSRSGPPTQPWLEPDVGDVIAEIAAAGGSDVVVVPIGFVSDHIEVLFDLDTEAKKKAESSGVRFERAATVGTHPQFVAMLRELIVERMKPDAPRRALGPLGPRPDVCALDCCPAPVRPAKTLP